MEENVKAINFEEVHDNEIDDIWSIFFPNTPEKREVKPVREQTVQTKPRRYLRFLTM